MHSIISITDLYRLHAQLASNRLTNNSSAISAEASVVSTAGAKVANSTEQSMALFGEKAKALSELIAVKNKCADNNWDSDGAEGVSPISVHLAEQFIRAMPDDLPLPEIDADPDGAIFFEWIQSRTRRLSLSVENNGRLAYAYLDGTNQGHAVESFDGQHIPPPLLEAIERIMGRYAGLRTA